MEYINGEIVLLASPSTYHQDISGNLHIHLRSYLKGKNCKVFYAPFDVHFYKKDLKTPDVMQPDLLIACDLENNVNENADTWVHPRFALKFYQSTVQGYGR